MKRRKRQRHRDHASSPSMNKSSTTTRDGLFDLVLLLLLPFFFLLCSPLVRSNPDSHVCSNRTDHHLKETLLKSFLSYTKNTSFCRIQNSPPAVSQKKKGNLTGGGAKNNETSPRSAYVGLDEIRNKTMQQTKKSSAAHEVLGKITHRVEPGGKEYNYASASKGAKVLAHNKEAKGAGNILERDADKYLRNPCSIGGKFVVVELSEETLVDSVNIANLEHYSSNFKEFVLLGSLSYPTEAWIPLGNFTAVNGKHAQRFTLLEPKWVRYMRLNLVSHYGSEFYCTLSSLEVYGVDAIEKMLENLIDEPGGDPAASSNSSAKGDVVERVERVEVPAEGPDVVDVKNDVPKKKEARQQSGGRVPGDAVLKILMQKLSSLELSMSVLEEYTKELDRRYGGSLPDIQKDVSQKTLLLEKIGSEIKDLMESRKILVKEFGELELWKSTVSDQVDALVKNSAYVRENVETILRNQESMENKELVVLMLSFLSACFALLKLTCDRILMPVRYDQEKMYSTSSGWLLLFVSSSTATLITLLYS